jgi:hypothetical protein
MLGKEIQRGHSGCRWTVPAQRAIFRSSGAFKTDVRENQVMSIK